MMIILKISRLFIANNMEVNRRLMLISLRGYRLWANYEIPVQSFGKLYGQGKLDEEMILSKNQLFNKIKYTCMYNQTRGRHFKLIKDEEVKAVSFQFLFGLLKLKLFDVTFKPFEFVRNSEQALLIVINKIAEEEFSDLNELLTPECLSKVKENIAKLNSLEKSSFIVNTNMTFLSFLSEIHIEPDVIFKGKQSGETTVTIVVVSVCITPIPLDTRSQDKFVVKHYHTEFKRSYRNNFKGDWIISDMNMGCQYLTN